LWLNSAVAEKRWSVSGVSVDFGLHPKMPENAEKSPIVISLMHGCERLKISCLTSAITGTGLLARRVPGA